MKSHVVISVGSTRYMYLFTILSWTCKMYINISLVLSQHTRQPYELKDIMINNEFYKQSQGRIQHIYIYIYRDLDLCAVIRQFCIFITKRDADNHFDVRNHFRPYFCHFRSVVNFLFGGLFQMWRILGVGWEGPWWVTQIHKCNVFRDLAKPNVT